MKISEVKIRDVVCRVISSEIVESNEDLKADIVIEVKGDDDTRKILRGVDIKGTDSYATVMLLGTSVKIALDYFDASERNGDWLYAFITGKGQFIDSKIKAILEKDAK